MSGPVVGKVLLELGSVKSDSVMTQYASLAARTHSAASPPRLRVNTYSHTCTYVLLWVIISVAEVKMLSSSVGPAQALPVNIVYIRF